MDKTPEEVEITTAFIRLDQFLKLASLVSGGGEAKELIREGAVTVDGEVETRRGRKLYPGALVRFEGDRYRVVARQG